MAQLVLDVGNLLVVDRRDGDDRPKDDDLATRDAVQRLVAELFERCPSVPCENGVGRIATLPEPVIKCPREKPVPEAKPLTKWERFRRERGIAKKKRDKIAYDEESGEWRRTYGYKRANNELDQWAIEHKEGDDASVDPFTKMKRDKKERVRKNAEKQQKNIAEARGDRVPGTLDLSSAVSSSTKGKKSKRAKTSNKHEAMSHLETSLGVAQRATASMGRFDRPAENEKPIAPLPVRTKKQFAREYAIEKKHSLSILNQVLGKAPKETEAFDSKKAVNRAHSKAEKTGRTSAILNSANSAAEKKKVRNAAARTIGGGPNASKKKGGKAKKGNVNKKKSAFSRNKGKAKKGGKGGGSKR